MQKTTTNILLFCLTTACLCPAQLGTLLCFKNNGTVSIEMGTHCCQGHADHASLHAEKKHHTHSDEDCLSDVHVRCCTDVPLGRTALDSIKPNPAGENDLRAAQAVCTLRVLANPRKSPFKPYSMRLNTHSPPADSIVLLI